MRSWTGVGVMLLAGLAASAVGVPGVAQDADDRPEPQGKTLELSQSFHTRSPWRLVVTEGPQTADFGNGPAPGALTLCLYQGAGPCVSGPVTPEVRKTTPDDTIAWEPHYLFRAEAVYPNGRGGEPLLLIATGSVYSGDGDQIRNTLLVAYDRARDQWRSVYRGTTGRNNNQEIRFVEDGPLRGAVIVAEPEEHLPFGYWITVSKRNGAGDYRRVLRFDSATRYGDGNPLAVIDSEMPNIERRLGVWKPGDPLPVPKLSGGRECVHPGMKRGELWCGSIVGETDAQ